MFVLGILWEFSLIAFAAWCVSRLWPWEERRDALLASLMVLLALHAMLKAHLG